MKPFKDLGNGRATIEAPIANKRAQAGLLLIDNIDVEFKDDVTKAQVKSALVYLDKLIEFWNLPYHEWNQ